MKMKLIHIVYIIAAVAMASACSKSYNDYPEAFSDYDGVIYKLDRLSEPVEINALVTVKCDAERKAFLQYGPLKLRPDELEYTRQERAMANLTILPGKLGEYYNCTMEWIEPIELGTFSMDNSISLAPGDGIALIMDSGFTTVEDGYLTVHYFTWWGENPKHHDFYLSSGVNPENPYALELRQDSHEDGRDTWSEGLVCFDINGLPDTAGETKIISLNWIDTEGASRTSYFEFKTRE